MRKIIVGVTLAAGVLTGTLASAVPATAAPSPVGNEITPMLWAPYKSFRERQDAIDVGEYGKKLGWWRAYYIEWLPKEDAWMLNVDYI